ncbi:AAA ATPase domain-containing protein [Chloropicon primus]|uniref:ATPase AAA-type core domain-containing protein n=2 Tax=Chloropicon primus TaxID=1764295 RepID=A0A5B8MVG7_9CHLO|nr:hypothetical protein A3770_10p60200 [Chloropicon primus]UPR02714.1 AAA ATPase domain-containing protein [Chloropicon primus]|eukprot:QDZ23502.1 hypothetical protein A3770_10p60200 [Chloropicon primus]
MGRPSVLDLLGGKKKEEEGGRKAAMKVERGGEAGSGRVLGEGTGTKRREDSACIRLGLGNAATKEGSRRRAWLYRPCSRKRKPDQSAGRLSPREGDAKVRRSATKISASDEGLLRELLAFVKGTPQLAGASPGTARAGSPAPRLSLGLEDVIERDQKERAVSRRLSSRILRRRKAKDSKKASKPGALDEWKVLAGRYRDYLHRKGLGTCLHWEQRYRPSDLENHQTVNSSSCERIRRWLQGWSARRRDEFSSEGEGDFVDAAGEGTAKDFKKAGLLLVGPPGSGKTAAISALAASCQKALVEVNSSESRTGDRLKKKIKEATQSSSENSKEAVCAIEEIDVNVQEDRGFLSAIADVLSTTKRPMMLTCNDLKRIPSNILELVEAVEFRRPSLRDLFCHCALILMAESVQVDWQALLGWLERNGGGDYRSCVNNLQLCGGAASGCLGNGQAAGDGDLPTGCGVELASQMDTKTFERIVAQEE